MTRAKDLLTGMQRDDGSFQTFEGTKNELLPWDDLRTTCIVAWGLAVEGSSPGEVDAALGYIQEHLDLEADSYTLAMCLNALMTAAPESEYATSVLATLVARVAEDGPAAYWTTDFPGLTQSGGDIATVETTAFVAQALFRLDVPHPLAERALAYLARHKSPDGNFLTSQGTIQALRAFVQGAKWQSKATNATVTVRAGDVVVATQVIDGKNRDVVHIVSLSEWAQAGDVDVAIEVAGEGTLNYQLASTHYIPWGAMPRPRGPLLDVAMTWSPSTVAAGGTVSGTVTVTSNGQALGAGDMPMVHIPIPPGFDVDTAVLGAALAAGKGIARYETKDDHLLVYLHGVPEGQTTVLEETLAYRPRFAMTVTTPVAKTWPFYKPEETSMSAVEVLTVTP